MMLQPAFRLNVLAAFPAICSNFLCSLVCTPLHFSANMHSGHLSGQDKQLTQINYINRCKAFNSCAARGRPCKADDCGNPCNHDLGCHQDFKRWLYTSLQSWNSRPTESLWRTGIHGAKAGRLPSKSYKDPLVQVLEQELVDQYVATEGMSIAHMYLRHAIPSELRRISYMNHETPLICRGFTTSCMMWDAGNPAHGEIKSCRIFRTWTSANALDV